MRTSQLRVAKDEAERANAAKSEFLATMSHEIRTPMNGMMVMAEMLSAAPLSPRHLRYAEIISRSGRGLLNIINDILDLSKIEAGQLRLEEIPFSLDAIVEDAAALFAERAREKGLAISVFVAPELPRMLIGDPTRISQVVGNLLNNALKFTERGGVSIEVHREGEPRADGSVDVGFLVRDTGIGIARDKVELIFERFSQADGSITRRFGGTGLGLSISRMLVEAMGGSISVASEVGLGSTFSFCIRLPEMEAAQEPVRLDGRRIGVLASSAIVLEGLCKALRARGAEVALDDAPSADAVLVQSGQEHRLAVGNRPVVLLRDFATSPAALPDAIIPAGELSLPVGRVEFDVFVDALASGNWDRMTGRSPAAPPVALADLSGLRVLAVDDTAVNREVLNEALGAFRIQAHLAESGPGAIEMVRKQSYDIIFMDCSMPGMDGFQATAEIRDVESRLRRDPAKIVALTAHVTGPEAARWRDAGMDAYVSKPFTIAQLAQVLEDRAPAPAVAAAGDEADAAAESNSWQSVPLLAPETLGMFRSLSRTQGNALAAKVFGLFDTHSRPALEELQASLSGDPTEAAKAAHALKSMCLSAGAGRAASICGGMEDRLKQGAGVGQTHIDALSAALQESRDAMTAYLMQDAAGQRATALSA
ncbi:MAG: ATP-binding protein [Mesorhizobium sp.]|nr:ATP-binding protein [Mesorhizobium sp.]